MNEDLKQVNSDTETYFISDYRVEDENTHHGGGNKGKSSITKQITKLRRTTSMKTDQEVILSLATISNTKLLITSLINYIYICIINMSLKLKKTEKISSSIFL